VAECVNFGSNSLRISDDDVHAFERLLTGGVWAQVEVEWDESDSKAPFSISQLTPIQLASFNLDEYRKLRTQFSTEEWIDLLIRSMGYEPSQFSQRLKLLFLLREGDIRESPYYFSVPGDNKMEIGYIIKQDNNGDCFVASPVPLPHLKQLDYATVDLP
jgi:ATP-dependent Lon protease